MSRTPATSTIYAGIEVGGSKLQFVLGDREGKILTRHRVEAAASGGAESIRLQITEGVRHLLGHCKPARIGVGFGGPVDWRTGVICCSHQVQGWAGFPLAQWLHETTGIPVIVENDSNLAALAEATVGAGSGFASCFYFNLGSGVGGGFVTNGRIYHGAPPGEAEFGHIRLDRTGTTVESRCSGWAVDQRIRNLVRADPLSCWARLIGDTKGGEARHLNKALDLADRDAITLVEELADDLGFAISHVLHLMHPEVIVMGGGLALVGERLRSAVDAAMRKHLMEAFQPGPPLCLARLSEDAVPVGALLLAGQSSEEP